ncbi:hypothetical protein H4S07_002179, partial [Coemansia furcata]
MLRATNNVGRFAMRMQSRRLHQKIVRAGAPSSIQAVKQYVGRRHFSGAQVHHSAKAPVGDAVAFASELARTGAKLDVKKVLVVGSGGLSIGQAGEFDYS